jgi:hypothetical protein
VGAKDLVERMIVASVANSSVQDTQPHKALRTHNPMRTVQNIKIWINSR